jgi:hypothetical protein
MKFLEKVFIILAVIGLFVRAMMWQGGELFLTVALPSLAVLYLLMSWAVFKHHEEGHHLFLSILSGLTFSVVFIGILFKLMIWRGGNTLLVAGLSAMVISKILGLILENKLVRELDGYFKKLFLRYYIIAAVGTIMWLTPYKFIVSVYHRDDPEYVHLFIRYFEEPDNMKYRAEFLQHRRKKFKEQWDVKEYKD